MTLPVALQIYSVRDEMNSDFAGSMKKVKEIGYDGIEFGGVDLWDAGEVKKIIDDNGLKAISAHVAFDTILENPEKVFNEYRSYGCEYIAIPWLDAKRAPGGECFNNTINSIIKLGSIANTVGIKLLYHNHDFEFIKVDGIYGLDMLYESVPADILGTQIDTCWVRVAKIDPAEYLLKYKNRAPLVHLKDFIIEGKVKGDLYELVDKDDDVKINREGFDFRPLGQGLQDIPSILKSSLDIGAKWVIVEQDSSSTCTPFEAAKISRDYLKSLGW